jgi:hypothetical protein
MGMTAKVRFAAVLVALTIQGVARTEAAGIGDYTGTSTPQVIVPQTTFAPQTPAYSAPQIGPTFIGAPGTRFHHHQHRRLHR